MKKIKVLASIMFFFAITGCSLDSAQKAAKNTSSKVKGAVKSATMAGLTVAEFPYRSSHTSLSTGGDFLDEEIAFFSKISKVRGTGNSNNSSLSFYDSKNKILKIPSSLIENSSFSRVGDFIVLNISNGDADTSVVVHSSANAFVTFGTSLVGIEPATSAQSENISVHGASSAQSGVRVSALKADDGRDVSVVLLYYKNKIFALEQ